MTKFKEFKKSLAGVLAMAMVFSPMVTATAYGASSSVSGNIHVSGNLAGFTDKNVAITAILPSISTDNLQYKLDPQGLLKISENENGEHVSAADKYADTQAGDIVFTNKISSAEVSVSSDLNKSNVIYAVNKSPYDVTFQATVNATTDSVSADTAINFVSSTAAAVSGNDRNVYLAIVPEQNYINYDRVSVNNRSGEVRDFKAISSNAATDYAIPVNESGTSTIKYRMSGISANWNNVLSSDNTTYKYAMTTDANWTAVGFTITGACNPNADWLKFNQQNKNLSLDITWDMVKAGETEAVSANGHSAVPDGLVKSEVEPSVTTLNTLGYNASTHNFWISLPGDENASLEKLSNFTVTPQSGSAVAFENGKLTATNKSICITWSNLSAGGISWPSAGTTLTFNFTYDGVNYQAVYTQPLA